MTLELRFTAANGAVRAGIGSADSWYAPGAVIHLADVHGVIATYEERCREVRRRNPDMTAEQAHALVLSRWWHELKREAESA